MSSRRQVATLDALGAFEAVCAAGLEGMLLAQQRARQVERADWCTCFFPVLSGPDRAALPVVATVFDKLNQEYKRYLDAEQSYAAVSDRRRCAEGSSPVVVAAAGNGSNSGPCIPSPLVPPLVWGLSSGFYI